MSDVRGAPTTAAGGEYYVHFVLPVVVSLTPNNTGFAGFVKGLAKLFLWRVKDRQREGPAVSLAVLGERYVNMVVMLISATAPFPSRVSVSA